MAAAGREVHEPGSRRLLGADAVKPVDRLVRHVVREVVLLAVLALRDALDLLVLPDQRVVLSCAADEEPPEVVEPEAVRPPVEGPARPLLVVRREMPLANARREVPVL